MQKAGTLLSNRYRIRKVLGRGGMGAVYLVEAEALGGKFLAVKEMIPWGLPPGELEQAVAQFKREASFLAYLEHPNLVKVTDFFVEDGKHYLVMAYIRGTTLQQKLLSQSRPFCWTELEPWAHSLLDVLEYLHSQNPAILFRDLKPSNIMISEEGQLHLIDFGIARSAEEGLKTTTFLQGTGTRGFSPIEQYGDRLSTDQRSDIYSLGATLYYLLTGSLPPDAIERVSKRKKLTSLRQKEADIPASLEQVVERALAIDADERYQTVAEMREALMKPRTLLPTFRRKQPTHPTASLLQRGGSLVTAGLMLTGSLLFGMSPKLKISEARLFRGDTDSVALATQLARGFDTEIALTENAIRYDTPSSAFQSEVSVTRTKQTIATARSENSRPAQRRKATLSLMEDSYPKALPLPHSRQLDTAPQAPQAMSQTSPSQPSVPEAPAVVGHSQPVTGPTRPAQPVVYTPIYVPLPEGKTGIPGLDAPPVEPSSSIYTTSTQWASRGETTDPTQSGPSGGPSLTNLVGRSPGLANPEPQLLDRDKALPVSPPLKSEGPLLSKPSPPKLEKNPEQTAAPKAKNPKRIALPQRVPKPPRKERREENKPPHERISYGS